MRFDQQLIFSDAQSIAQVAGSYLSDKSVDTQSGFATFPGTPAIGGPLLGDFGRVGTHLDIAVVVTTAVTSAGAATLQLQIIQADDAALTANVEVLRETRALPAGAGTSIFGLGVYRVGRVPSMSRRYVGLRYVIGAATTTAGVVTAGLAYGVPSNAADLIG